MGVLGNLLAGGGYRTAAGEIKLDGGSWYVSGARSADGQQVTQVSAMSISSWFAAHRILSTQFMKAPLKLYKRTKDGGREEVDSALANAVKMHPNDVQNAIYFKQWMFSNAFWGGKAIAVIDVNPETNKVSLVPLHPNCVEIKQDENTGSLYFVYRPKKEKPQVFFEDEVLHFPGIITIDGIRGIDILTYAATQIGIADKQYSHIAHQLKNRGMPIGKFKSPSVLSDEQKANIKAEYMEMIAGPENSGKVMVVSGDADFEPLSMNNAQMELIAMARLSIQDTGRFTGVPPVMMFDNSESTWNNNPEQNRFFLEYGLDPWLVAFEMVCNTQLIAKKDQNKFFFEFDRSAFTAMDLEKTSKALLDGKYGGWINGDEARAKLNMPPMENGLGKIYWRPGNMAPADAPYVPGGANNAVSDPQNSPQNLPKTDKKTEKVAKNEGKPVDREVFEPLVRSAFSRVLTKMENDRAKLNKKEAFSESWVEYRKEKMPLFLEELAPVVSAVIYSYTPYARSIGPSIAFEIFQKAWIDLKKEATGNLDCLIDYFFKITEVKNDE